MNERIDQLWGQALDAAVPETYSRLSYSHPSNRVDELKSLAGWINEHMPEQACGSYDAVEKWLGMSDDDRRTALERAKLIYDTKTEVWLILKNEHTSNPYFTAYDWAVE